MSSGIIYIATNTKNGKKYVGKTIKSLSQRRREHQSKAANGSKNAFHAAIRRYGKDAFVWSIVEEADESQLADLEIKYIALHNTHVKRRCGYNMTPGGEGVGSGELHPMYGRRGELSPTFGRQLTPEQKANLVHSGPRSAESCRKQSKTVAGEGNHFFGRSHSAESLEKMSAWQIGKTPSQTVLDILLVAAKRPRSEETKARMSAAAKARWAKRKAA